MNLLRVAKEEILVLEGGCVAQFLNVLRARSKIVSNMQHLKMPMVLRTAVRTINGVRCARQII